MKNQEREVGKSATAASKAFDATAMLSKGVAKEEDLHVLVNSLDKIMEQWGTMKKNSLIVLLSIISFIKINAQADCLFKYYYIGKISLKTKKPKSDSDIFIHLPSPELIMDIVDKTKGFIKVKISSQLNYEKESVTIGSSLFCGTPDNIIEKTLKGNHNFYTIYIIKGKRKYKKNICVKDIIFLNKDGTIYIILPVIVI